MAERETIRDIIACMIPQDRMVMDGALDRLVEVHRTTPTCWARSRREAGHLKAKTVRAAIEQECRHPDCYPPLVLG